MPEQDHVCELLPAYALGSLEDEEESRVAEHLARCPACCTELADYWDIAGSLASAAPDAAPPEKLKERLIGRVRPAQVEDTPGPHASWWRQFAALMRRTAPVWVTVSLLLIVALGVSNLLLWREASRPGQMRALSLRGTEAAPAAIGTVIVSTDGEHGALVVDGLAPLDAAHQYQVWLIRDGECTSGGTFSVDADGYGVLWLSAPAALSSYDAIGITIEPAGGSPGPTGAKVLGGSL